MNHSQPYLDSQASHISNGPSYAPQSQTAGGMSQYQYPPQQSPMQSGPGSYGTPTHPNYPNYYGGVTSPQSAGQPVTASMTTQLAPLPAMSMGHQHAYGGSAGNGSQYHNFDSTGQVAPPGAKPRVTATLWEDEGSLCFQVETKGVCVARREDNHFINGTKLLNVAGMTRGRRDGILKSEKTRHVVKIGPMHLKGVWIPFDRALDFANREKITELLYPLFVHNIGALLYHPTNSNRTNMVMEAAAKRRSTMDNKQPGAMIGTPQAQSASLLHHHSMSGQMPSQLSHAPHSIAPSPNNGRPGIDRAHTFPTPPTSASSIIGNSSSGSSYNWDQNINQTVQGSQPLAIDTGLSNARSMPSTPATTPPATSMQNMQGYPNQHSYDSSRSIYSAAPQQQSQYATQQHNMARFGQPMPSQYMKNDMGPPSRATGDAEHSDIKQDPYSHSQGGEHVGHGAAEDEADHDHDGEYSQDANNAYNTSRGSYSYAPPPSMGSLHQEHSHMSQEQVNGSPHQNGSGRVTPRTSVSQSWPASGYGTPPRTSSSLYNVMSDNRGSLSNGHAVTDPYSAYPSVNGASNKRGRDDDDDYKTGADIEALKRRKSGREGSISAPLPAYNHAQNSTIIRSARR